MLGKHLVLPKSSPNGLICNSVLVMEHLEVEKQYFLSVTYDHKSCQPVITYSDVGGLSWTRLNQLYPDRIHKIYIDYIQGIDFRSLQQVAHAFGMPESYRAAFLIKNLYECFLQRDCLEIQINPLVLTPQHNFVAANVQIEIDPDALYRQSEINTWLDLS